MSSTKLPALVVGKLLILAFFLFPISNAYAVNLQYLRYSPVSEFTPEDFELLQTTGVGALVNNDDGKVSSWNNPETGHSGTITPLETSTIDGMHCRKTRIINQGSNRSGEVVFTFCKIKDKWKVLK